MKCLKIPIKDIENIENVRIMIHGLIEHEPDIKIARFINNVTSKLYKLTHKKYPIIEE